MVGRVVVPNEGLTVWRAVACEMVGLAAMGETVLMSEPFAAWMEAAHHSMS